MITLGRKALSSSIRLCSLTTFLLAAVKYEPSLNLCYLAKSAKRYQVIILCASPVGSP